MKIPFGLKKTATLCVLKNGQKFMLLKRFKPPNKGLYTPVGGKLEPHESPLNAAIRETFEETGIDVGHMKFCGLLTETSPVEYNWTNYVYLAEIECIPPPPCNEGELKWIDFDEVLHVPAPKTDWYIYKYILEKKPFAFHAEFDDRINLIAMTEEIENLTVYEAS
ncbi:MAG: NUDIX domain-containing protein [Cytophagales bacterium]|nr:NUDIX domain-containing protein [Cytophagales bacterium]